MSLTAIATPDAPAWDTLPYPQAVRVGDLVFVSGQIALDSLDGVPVEGIEAQTEAVFGYLRAILEAAGSSLAKVVKTMCYLTDRERDYAGFNDVYRRHLTTAARSTVEVKGLAPGCLIEIEVVAQA